MSKVKEWEPMPFGAFAEKVSSDVLGYLPPREYASYGVETALYINGLTTTCISAGKIGSFKYPGLVRIEPYYEDYLSGRDWKELLTDIAIDVRLDVKARNFEKVKEYIEPFLVSAVKNATFLERHAHRAVPGTDLALLYGYAFKNNEGQPLRRWSMQTEPFFLTSDVVKEWPVTNDELYALALANRRRLHPHKIADMTSVVTGAGAPRVMYVLTNIPMRWGAAEILDEKVIEELAERFGDFYVIPSSVHELIILPRTEKVKWSPAEITKWIKDVNRGVLSQDEILSDSLYVYKDGRLQMA